ncbi:MULTISPECIES: hypothetical protein [unclassified Streptomyces]|uniref:hypothetical protein n=1 Tax=unclassified Streptomyces TaxID=2593676 RepID=UPI0033310C86
MDEMTAVQSLRADAPVPDHARLTPARQRLLDEIAEPRRSLFGFRIGLRAGSRTGRRLRTLGAVAAVVAAVSLSTLPLRPDHSSPATPASAPSTRPNQWVYQNVQLDAWSCLSVSSGDMYSEVGVFALSSNSGRPCTPTPTRQVDTTRWVRYDGEDFTLPSAHQAGPDAPRHIAVGGNADMLTPQDTDALVAALPDDPDAALQMILKKSIPTRVIDASRLTQAQRDFDEILEVLSASTVLPPDKAHTIYRIIMGLDGVTEPVEVTDGAGRTVLAIGIDGNFRDKSYAANGIQVLLDPETYAYRGVRWVAGLDYYVGGKASGGPFVAKGTVIGTATRVSTEIVDASGERG